MTDNRVLMKGNIGAAEAAFLAGLDFYAGYPITPQTEILEHLASRMPEAGRAFLQAESEIASICMIYGAASTGKRVLTSSSGPGISLKQEGISYCAANNLPIVYINVQRGGNGLATLGSCQTEYKRETNGGGNGDYHAIILAPASVQETVDMVYGAFDIAEKFRNPVGILSEGCIAQLVEPVTLPPAIAPKTEFPVWAKRGQRPKLPQSSGGNPKMKLAAADRDKIARMREEAQDWEEVLLEDAEHVVVAFGGPSRVAYDSILALRAKGLKIGMIRPKTLWPFPDKAFKKLGSSVKSFITLETNYTCQMARDVIIARASSFKDRHVPIYSFGYICNRLPTVKDTIKDIQSAVAGRVEEFC